MPFQRPTRSYISFQVGTWKLCPRLRLGQRNTELEICAYDVRRFDASWDRFSFLKIERNQGIGGDGY
jgi:hypothetical protein